MPAKLPIKVVLERMSKDDLIDLVDRQGLSLSGNKSELIDRLVKHHGRDLAEVMRRSHWYMSDWNDWAEDAFFVGARKSFEELANILLHTVSPAGKLEEQLLEIGAGMSISELREDDEAQEELQALLGVTPRRLSAFLNKIHGRTDFLSIVQNLAALKPAPTSSDETAFVAVTESSVLPVSQTQRIAWPRTGDTLADQFRIISELGNGGQGRVYEVIVKRTEQKRIAKLENNPSRGDLRNEFEKAKDLDDHPNLCRVFRLETDAQYGEFLVVQHGGESIHKRFARGTSLDEALHVAKQAAEGLDYLHSKNVLHGDVSPGNILIDQSNRVRLCDFGISGFLERAAPDLNVTRVATSVRGRHPLFSAIEVHYGHPGNKASDQQSLARVVQWMLFGNTHFGDHEHVHRRMSELNLHIRAAIERALHSNPSSRFASCQDFVRSLSGSF